MLYGEIVGAGTQVITTRRGEAAIRNNGLTPYIADPSVAPLAISKTRNPGAKCV
jgi:hypothetical protein